MNKKLFSLLLRTFDEGGTEILSEERKFRAYMKDLNEGLLYDDELNRFLKMCDPAFLSFFYRCREDTEGSLVGAACTEAAAYLENDGFYHPQKAKELAETFAAALRKWNGLPETVNMPGMAKEQAEPELKPEEKAKTQEKTDAQEKKAQEEKERLEREAREKKKRENDEREARAAAAAARIAAAAAAPAPVKKSSGPLKPVLILLVLCGIGYMIFRNTGGRLPGSGQGGEKATMVANTPSPSSGSYSGTMVTKETEARTGKETEARTEKETQARTEEETQKGNNSSQSSKEKLDLSNPGVIYEVQTALNAASYNCGTPDGIAGRKTKQAIQAYKNANGMNDDSKITSKLLQKLGIEMTRAEMVMHEASLKADMAKFWVNDKSDDSRTDITAFFTNADGTHGGFLTYNSDGNVIDYAFCAGRIETIETGGGEETFSLLDESPPEESVSHTMTRTEKDGRLHLVFNECGIDEELTASDNNEMKDYVIRVMRNWWKWEYEE